MSTLLELRTLARRKLNEHTATNMWTDPDLDAYLQEAFEGFQRMAVRRDPKFGNSHFDVTYPARADEHEVPLTQLDPAVISSVRDRSNSQPGPAFGWADSHESLKDAQDVGGLSLAGVPAKVFIDRVGDNLRIHVGPTPQSALSLRIYFQQSPANFASHDSMRTGLPDPYEKCIVLEAVRSARHQEQNLELVQSTSALLREAKIDIARYVRSLRRGSKRVRYDPADYM